MLSWHGGSVFSPYIIFGHFILYTLYPTPLSLPGHFNDLRIQNVLVLSANRKVSNTFIAMSAAVFILTCPATRPWPEHAQQLSSSAPVSSGSGLLIKIFSERREERAGAGLGWARDDLLHIFSENTSTGAPLVTRAGNESSRRLKSL